MESYERAVETDIPRKRSGVNKQNWAREKAKKIRYSPKALPQLPKCNHPEKSVYRCCNISGKDALHFFKAFYKEKCKKYQDSFILNYSKCNPPRRCDRRKAGPKKSISMKHFLRKCNGKIIRICQKAFLNILRITAFRVKNTCLRHLRSGEMPIDLRGGDRTSHKFLHKKQAIIDFIKKFQIVELHYCRSRNAKRQYLPADLNINRMAQLFNQEHPELDVTKSYFRNIFNTKFNIGFKMPSSDQCSYCLSIREQIKLEKSVSKRKYLLIQKRIHTLRGKAFFNKLKEEPNDVVILSFDCQKNLPLPKVQDQAAYYSRQIYLYNFGVVQGSSKCKLSQENVYLYTWTEDTFFKGSNQIASAVYHRLCHLNLDGKTKVRLFADGCGGQNKNSIMMGMCSFWLVTKAPVHVKSVQFYFPVTGHSFIPPDRVFAQVEKKIRKKEAIINPEEYLEILSEHGRIVNLGEDDCVIRDWKTEVLKYFKPPAKWHFKFTSAKRFIITRSKKQTPLIRGEISYNSDLGKAYPVLRKGQNIKNMNPEIIQRGVHIKSEKKKDVTNLLQKHFGEGWKEKEELQFYKTILETEFVHTEEEVDLICEAHDDDSTLIV